MIELKQPKLEEVEQVIGKKIIENIETIREATEEVLRNNLDLRKTENRHIVRLLVEKKTKKTDSR